MPKCEICNKTRTIGHQVSRSNIKSKRKWAPNVQRVKAVVGNTTKRIYVCTKCLRSGKVKRPAH